MNTPIFYVLLFVHLISLCVGFGAVVVIDSFGLLWLLKIKNISLSLITKVANVTQMLIWLGFTGLVASGIPMLVLKGHVDNLTKVKLFLVVMVGLNGIFLHFIKRMFEKLQDENNIPKVMMFRMSLASTISQTGWWGAIVIGFVHRHIEHNISWPSFWPYVIVFLAVFFVSIGFLGEAVLKKK